MTGSGSAVAVVVAVAVCFGAKKPRKLNFSLCSTRS